MEKTIKLRSQFLSSLNEALQKLNLNDKVTKFTPVIVEADGKFTSIVKADDTFDPSSLGNGIDSEEEQDTPETKETKQQLLNKATDTLKQTLENSKELEEILKKIRNLAKEDGYNDWVVNKQGNTASLKSKNAYIFKQNNNLCLSHNGKVELFHSVDELRKWLEENNYPLPKADVVIHESVLTEDSKKKGNPNLDDFYSRVSAYAANNPNPDKSKAEPQDWSKEGIEKQIAEVEQQLAVKKQEKANKFNSITKDLDIETHKKRLRDGYLASRDAMLRRASELERAGLSDKARSLKHAAAALSDEGIEKKVEFEIKQYPEEYCNTNPEYRSLCYEITQLNDYIRILKKKLNPEKSLEQIGLGKPMDPSIFKGPAPKVPTKIPLVKLNRDSNMDECFGGVGVANLGSAVQYLGNKKKQTKKNQDKEEKESLDEAFNFGVQLIPYQNNDYIPTNAVKKFITWFGKNYPYIKQGQYKDKAGELEKLPNGWEEGIRNNASKINSFRDSLIRTRGAHGNWPLAVRECIENIIKAGAGKLFDSKKAAELNITTIEQAEDIITKTFEKNNPAIPLKEIENYLTKKLGGNFENHLYQNENDTIRFLDIEPKLIAKGNANSVFNPFTKFKNEWCTKSATDSSLGSTTKRNFDLFDKWLNHEDVDTLSKEDLNYLNMLKKMNPNLSDEQAKQLLANIRQQKESTQLGIFESAKNYPWLSKIMGQRLVEDDSPADFATGSPIASDMASVGDTGGVDAGTTGADAGMSGGADIPTMDFAGEAQQGGFGDVDISVGGGDYSPEGDEQQMPMPNMPSYKIIDVLANEDDPMDIKVKVQNEDTKEVEIKNLDEIDV